MKNWSGGDFQPESRRKRSVSGQVLAGKHVLDVNSGAVVLQAKWSADPRYQS